MLFEKNMRMPFSGEEDQEILRQNLRRLEEMLTDGRNVKGVAGEHT